MKPWCSRRTSLIFPVVTLEKGFGASFFDVAVACHFGTCCVFLPTPSSDIRRAVSLFGLCIFPVGHIYIYSLRGFSKLLRDKIRSVKDEELSSSPPRGARTHGLPVRADLSLEASCRPIHTDCLCKGE